MTIVLQVANLLNGFDPREVFVVREDPACFKAWVPFVGWGSLVSFEAPFKFPSASVFFRLVHVASKACPCWPAGMHSRIFLPDFDIVLLTFLVVQAKYVDFELLENIGAVIVLVDERR